MAMTDFLFTSESVTEGHPTKVADQISTRFWTRSLARTRTVGLRVRPWSRRGWRSLQERLLPPVTCTCPLSPGRRSRRSDINNSGMGFDWETCAVITAIDEQSSDIKMGWMNPRPRAGGRDQD